jgi:hypothetical protein
LLNADESDGDESDSDLDRADTDPEEEGGVMVKTPTAIFNGHPSNAKPRMISAGLL